jgi:hypothetical protein
MKTERKHDRSVPELPMKLIRMPDRSRGMRINCNGCFVILVRTETGMQVIVQANQSHVVTCGDSQAPDAAAIFVRKID